MSKNCPTRYHIVIIFVRADLIRRITCYKRSNSGVWRKVRAGKNEKEEVEG